MKKLQLSLCILSLLLSNTMRSAWILQHSGTTEDLGGIAFINATTGNAVGSNGTLLRTTNGGASWVAQTAPSNFVGAYGLRILFLNNTNGYAMGWGHVIKTVDGGATWTTYKNAPHPYYFGLDAWNDSSICLTGQLRTYDNDCYVSATGVNGFQKLMLPGSNSNSQFARCQYLSQTKLVTIDFREMQFSNDAGLNWTKYTAQQLTGINLGQLHGNFGFNDFYFVDANVGYMVATDYGQVNAGNPNISGMIFKTTNGGLTWTLQKDYIKRVRGVKFLDANTGFAYGENGCIYKTSDGGVTWYGDVIPTTKINDVCIIDQDTAYVVCSNGDIWKTTDGGISTPLSLDLGLNEIQTPAIITQTANPVFLSLLLKNLGGNTLTNAAISYQIDGNPAVNGTINFTPGISNSSEIIANHPASLNTFLTPGVHTLKAWVNTLNGNAADMNHTNDTISTGIKVVLSTLNNKKVVLEEATGAWCGNCPGGTGVIDYLYDSLTAAGKNNFIPIAIHNNDIMATVEGDSISSTWDQGAFPMGWVDRKKDLFESGAGMDVTKWYSAVLKQLKYDAPLNIATQVAYDPSSRQMTISCATSFEIGFNRELRYHVFILEDSILSNQANYYNTWPASPFYGLGNPIINFKNKHVLRDVITPGGVWGQTIPAPAVQAGSTYNFTLNYTLPNFINEMKASVVVFVAYHDVDINRRDILNADALPLIPATGISTIETKPTLLGLYPNPIVTNLSMRISWQEQAAVSVEIIDVNGKTVLQTQTKLAKGINYMELNTEALPNGLYFIKVSDGKSSVSGKFVK